MSVERPLREESVNRASLEAYSLMRRDGWPADRALDRTLRRHRALHSSERRAVSERVYALLRRQLAIDSLLERTRPGFAVLPPAAQDLLRLCAARVLSGEEVEAVAAGTHLAGEDARALGRLSEERQKIDRLDPLPRLSLSASFPEPLAARWLVQFGPDAQRAAEAMNERAPLTIRANALKTSRDELLAALRAAGIDCQATRLAPLGIVLQTRVNAFSLAPFQAGQFELQDEGSQLLGMLVDAPPKLVVDACAGAGGKTLQLAAQMKNRGELFAFDVREESIRDLRQRARRAGVFNVQSRVIPPGAAGAREATADLAGRADRVLIDAPCSGTGSLRRNPAARYRFSDDELKMQTQRQSELLSTFADLVRPGGRLIYGTCSVLREENEERVERFLASRQDFARLPASLALGDTLAAQVAPEGFLQVAPHTHGTDGFFGAVLQRRQ